ncbi:cysteine peptidase family C39 domain-containing protein [Segatella bryantii]|nr:cysteine peptidase family C39 domain-containing protein [Segatella bryantii]
MICQNFGKEVSFSFLSNMCSCTNEGTSLLSISETAKKIGLKSICCKLSLFSCAAARCWTMSSSSSRLSTTRPTYIDAIHRQFVRTSKHTDLFFYRLHIL